MYAEQPYATIAVLNVRNAANFTVLGSVVMTTWTNTSITSASTVNRKKNLTFPSFPHIWIHELFPNSTF